MLSTLWRRVSSRKANIRSMNRGPCVTPMKTLEMYTRDVVALVPLAGFLVAVASHLHVHQKSMSSLSILQRVRVDEKTCR